MKSREQIAIEALTEAGSALASCYNVNDFPGDGTSSQDDALRTVRAALAALTPPAQGSIDAAIATWEDRVASNSGASNGAILQAMTAEITALRAALADRAARKSAAPNLDIRSLQEQANAWTAVYQTLSAVSPGWQHRENTGMASAVAAIKSLAAPVPSEPVLQGVPEGWTVEFDKWSEPGTIKVNSQKWGGTFLSRPEPSDIRLPALFYRLLMDMLATTATGGGESVVDERAAHDAWYLDPNRKDGTFGYQDTHEGIMDAFKERSREGWKEGRARLAPPPLPATDAASVRVSREDLQDLCSYIPAGQASRLYARIRALISKEEK